MTRVGRAREFGETRGFIKIIADACEHIHMFQRMCVLRDVIDTYEMDLNTTLCQSVLLFRCAADEIRPRCS